MMKSASSTLLDATADSSGFCRGPNLALLVARQTQRVLRKIEIELHNIEHLLHKLQLVGSIRVARSFSPGTNTNQEAQPTRADSESRNLGNATFSYRIVIW